MILVVLSTHAELASATARGHSYCETGEFKSYSYSFPIPLRTKRKPSGPCVMSWGKLRYTEINQNPHVLSFQQMYFVSSWSNFHKSIYHCKAEIMRNVSVQSNTKYTGLLKCHIGCIYIKLCPNISISRLQTMVCSIILFINMYVMVCTFKWSTLWHLLMTLAFLLSTVWSKYSFIIIIMRVFSII